MSKLAQILENLPALCAKGLHRLSRKMMENAPTLAIVAVAAAAVAVTWKLGSETVLVFGPESVSYERSRGIDRCILREILARAFFVKIPKYRKTYFQDMTESKKYIWEK